MTTATAASFTPAEIEALNQRFEAADPREIVRWAVDTFHPYLTWVEGFKLAVQALETDVSKLSCCA